MIKNKRLEELTEQLMKPSGKSDSVRGELIRAINRIGYRFYNDGDQIGIGYGNETCNAAGRYIGKHGSRDMVNALVDLWDGRVHDSIEEIPDHVYENRLNTLIEKTVEYADSGAPELDEETEDMFDHYEKEDEVYDQEEDYWEEEEEDEEWDYE